MKSKFYKEVYGIRGIKIVPNYNIIRDNYMRINTIFTCKIAIESINSIRPLFNLINKYRIKYYILGNGSNTLFKKIIPRF